MQNSPLGSREVVAAQTTAVVTRDAPEVPAKQPLRAGKLLYRVLAEFAPTLATHIYDKYDLRASSTKGDASLNPGDLCGAVSAKDYQKLEIIHGGVRGFYGVLKGTLGVAAASVAPLTYGLMHAGVSAFDVVGVVGVGLGLVFSGIQASSWSDQARTIRAQLAELDRS